jgi:hypothetical protein
MATFSKFVRPETPKPGVTSERDLDAIETILRYRFSPTSELVRLVGGHEDVTQRRLRKLWERQIVNRFAFPGIPNHGEFIYYLDNRRALDLLSQHGRLTKTHPQMAEELRLNREADYAGAVVRGEHMKLGFLRHSLMISRMHFMLEMTSRKSPGEIELAAWHQGAELRGHKVEVPEIKSRRVESGNDYSWEESDNLVRLPVEPDAMFSLRLLGRSAADQFHHFCYEADRGTMPMADMLKKFRAYYHFIKRQQKQRKAFGVHPIRAVLIETTDEQRARKLMEIVHHRAVLGMGKRSALFWFSISALFASATPAAKGRRIATYLRQPEIVVDAIWALPDLTMLALTDCENSYEPRTSLP